MDKITVRLKKEFIDSERVTDHNPEMVVRDDETHHDNLYLEVKDGFINVNIDSFASEELKTRFTEYCDDLYFLTDHYKLTGGQIPAAVLFSRGSVDIGLFLDLKLEFFEVEVY